MLLLLLLLLMMLDVEVVVVVVLLNSRDCTISIFVVDSESSIKFLKTLRGGNTNTCENKCCLPIKDSLSAVSTCRNLFPRCRLQKSLIDQIFNGTLFSSPGLTLKGQCNEIFDFRFSYESSSTGPLIIPIVPFRLL